MQIRMEVQKVKPTKRRSPPWIIGGVVLFSLVGLILLQSSNLWKSFRIETANDTLLLYGLSSLNFIAFIIFAFILLRSLVKLFRERRALQLGAQIKIRLLTYFIGLSILPIVAMAGFSYFFMNRAVDRWMSQIPRNVTEEAEKVRFLRQTQMSQMLVTLLEKQDVTNQSLTELAESGNLIFIEILSPNNEILVHSERKLDDDSKKDLDEKLKNSNVIKTNFPDGRQLIVVPDLRPDIQFAQLVQNSGTEFESVRQSEWTIRWLGLTTLGVLTFLLIFAATWIGFFISRNLTAPIKALAEGAGEIKSGNLSYRVNVLADDELGLLVDVFNQMSNALELNSIERTERRRYIETVLQSLSTGVISFDATDKITTINKAAVQMLKLEDANFKGLSLNELVGNENYLVLDKLLNRAKRIGQATEQTVLQRENSEISSQPGETLPVALTASALPDKNGVVLVIEDLTELLQAQRASAWQEVARRMAHEIKNPLTPIQLSAERIAKRSAQVLNPKSEVLSQSIAAQDTRHKTQDQLQKVIEESTTTIINEVSSLKTMVDEFSRFARLPNVKLESGDLNLLIEQTVFLYEDRDVKINLDLAKNLPKSMIDEEQLKRVFVNLIENAIEAFDAEQTDKRIQIRTFHDSARDLIVAEVSDNGHGITPSDFQKLFQPYFSTKGRGTGLGLAIVQRIITEHHGKIRASNLVKGAKFVVELPIIN